MEYRMLETGIYSMVPEKTDTICQTRECVQVHCEGFMVRWDIPRKMVILSREQSGNANKVYGELPIDHAFKFSKMLSMIVKERECPGTGGSDEE